MSGLYIHIPFCKKACHYCDFHFSTSLAKKDEMIAAIKNEIILKKNRFKNPIETIYFGGGTPSLLTPSEVLEIYDTISSVASLAKNPEITLEGNPDDLTLAKLLQFAKTPINRLSIGIQSFFDEDLLLMNRAHKAQEAEDCLQHASSLFNNITIDLIYGIPKMSNSRWQANIDKALRYKIQHISSYALTVEPNTALEKLIQKKQIAQPSDAVAKAHFDILVARLTQNGFIHYELSNFGIPDYFSKHNTAYWLGKEYVGVGPSAHSFHGASRCWNVANNAQYIKAISVNKIPEEREVLSETDQLNESIMTGLRTHFGVNLNVIETRFGKTKANQLKLQAQRFIDNDLLYWETNNTLQILKTTEKGKFLCDGIAADLFILDS